MDRWGVDMWTSFCLESGSLTQNFWSHRHGYCQHGTGLESYVWHGRGLAAVPTSNLPEQGLAAAFKVSSPGEGRQVVHAILFGKDGDLPADQLQNIALPAGQFILRSIRARKEPSHFADGPNINVLRTVFTHLQLRSIFKCFCFLIIKQGLNLFYLPL